MAGFFSLGSGSGSGNTPENLNINNSSNNSWVNPVPGNGVILYRNEEIYQQKGFEIWQQCVQVHHHHHPPYSPVLVGPTGSGGGGGGSRSSSSMLRGLIGGGISCQDCGNQAKKDCVHSRCRACCRSRGFDCPTHVRSTWVPAAKRRERQQQRATVAATAPSSSQPQPQPQQQSDIISHQKRQRELGLELGQHFPAELSSPAVFRCVRVHSADNADNQLAYQTAVNIGGRIFKGILYDQGLDSRYAPTTPSGGGRGAETANFMNAIATTTATANVQQPENPDVATLLDANAMYSPPISAFLAGTQFFHAPRS